MEGIKEIKYVKSIDRAIELMEINIGTINACKLRKTMNNTIKGVPIRITVN